MLLSIVSILAVFTHISADAKEEHVLCITPEPANVYNKDGEVYTISQAMDMFYSDRIEDGYVFVAGENLKCSEDDVLVGNEVIDYLKRSDYKAQVKVCVKKAEVKPIGSKVVRDKIEKGTVLVAEDVSKYSVRVMYEEELCYLRRSNVHVQYCLHNLEIPEYGLCDTDEIISNLNEAVAKLDNTSSSITRTLNTTELREQLVERALSFVGNPYVWGGTDPNTGADCSGFVGYVYKEFGVELPRCSYQQCEVGKMVDQYSAMPGDLLFFWRDGRSSVGHVGMYLGNNQMVEAKGTNYGIVVSDLDWDAVYVARSYLND